MITTLPRLVREVMRAHELRGLTREQRRERIMGAFYTSIRRVEGELPREQPLALILDKQSDLDLAIFFNYYTYPRHTRIYRTLGDYALDRSPERPKTLIDIDDEVRVSSYAELRAKRVTTSIAPASVPADGRETFLIPIAASIDGPPPDTYTTEATLLAERDATVTLTFYPSRATSELALRAGETKRLRDLVYEQFHRMDAGWLEVRATGPIRASFFFVNRGAAKYAGVPNATPATHFALHGSGKLWLLNPSDEPIEARVDGAPHVLAPRALLSLPNGGAIEAKQPVYAFLSERQADGNTRFAWP